MSRHWFGAVIRKTTFGHKGVNYANGNQYATGGGFSPETPEEKVEDEEDPETTGTTDPPPNTENWPKGSGTQKAFWNGALKGEATGVITDAHPSWLYMMAFSTFINAEGHEGIRKYASIELEGRTKPVRKSKPPEEGHRYKIILSKEASLVTVRVVFESSPGQGFNQVFP